MILLVDLLFRLIGCPCCRRCGECEEGDLQHTLEEGSGPPGWIDLMSGAPSVYTLGCTHHSQPGEKESIVGIVGVSKGDGLTGLMRMTWMVTIIITITCSMVITTREM